MSELFWIIFTFVAGLMFGSFANVIIFRLPRSKSVIAPPSFCFSCERKLLSRDMIPVFSFIFLKGRCRFCKTKISARYLIVEIICGLLFVAMVYYSPTLSAIPLSIFAFVLLVVSFIDWDAKEIPDSLLIIGAVAGVVWVALGHFLPELFPQAAVWNNALLGIFAGALPLLIIDRITLLVYKKDGFGYGDVKLMAVAGIFLGWQLTLLALLFAVMASFPFAVFLLIKQRVPKDENFDGYMAFAPFLCVGAVVALWFGEMAINFLLI